MNKPTPSATTKTLEDILHDFAVGLHEYANGRANGLVYGEELAKAKAAINHYTRSQVNEAEVTDWQSFVTTLQYCLEPRYGETVEETVKYWKKQAERVLESLKGGIDG